MGLGSILADALGVSNSYQATPYQGNAAAYQLPGADDDKARMQAAAAAAQQRQGVQAQAAPQIAATNMPQMASAQLTQLPGSDPNQQAQIQNSQMGLINAMQNRVAGNAPSVAEQQLRMGQNANMNAAQAQAASMRGNINPMLAARNLANGLSDANQQTNAQAGMMRAGEQQQAEGALAQQLNGQQQLGQNAAQAANQMSQFNTGNQNQALMQQGQNDFSRSMNQAQLGQQTSMANLQAAMQQRQMNDAQQQYYNSSYLGLGNTQLQASMARDAANQQAYQNAQGINAGVASQNTQIQGQLVGGILQGAASGGSKALMSDERLKTHIDRKGIDSKVGMFLDALDAAGYDYKAPEKHGEGRHYGIMAQSAAKTDVGRSFVLDTPEGLALDTRRGFGTLLAALKHVHERTKKLEEGGV